MKGDHDGGEKGGSKLFDEVSEGQYSWWSLSQLAWAISVNEELVFLKRKRYLVGGTAAL
jgi:hypothetical protein